MECTDCGGNDFVCSDGCDVCTTCGLVGRQVMVREHQYRQPESAAPKRGKPAGRAPAARGRHVSSKDRQKKRILEMTEALNIKESVANTAVFIYETAVSLPGWKNRKHDYQTGILVACIYHACDAHRCHRTPAELCVVLGIDPKNARRMVKYTEPAAEIANAGHHGSMSLAMQVLPRCIYRMGSIPSSKVAEVKKLSMRIYDRVRNEIDTGRTPSPPESFPPLLSAQGSSSRTRRSLARAWSPRTPSRSSPRGYRPPTTSNHDGRS
jgi:Transcription factor TFIIB repeat